MIKSIIYLLLPIYLSIIAGYLARKLGWVKVNYSQVISKTAMLFLMPFINIFTFWNLDLSNLGILYMLPIFGVLIGLSGMLAARLVSLYLGLTSRDRGTLMECGLFSNIGLSMGAYICYKFLGEQALGLAILYTMTFPPMFFTVGIYIARRANAPDEKVHFGGLLQYLMDPMSVVPFVGIIIGVLLNILGIDRHPFLGTVNGVIAHVSVVVFCVSIGLTIRLRNVLPFMREAACISIYKLLVSPFVGMIFVTLLGFHSFMDGLILHVVLIQSAMPVAILTLVLNQIYKLNQDMANACLIVSSVGVIPLLPVLYYLVT